MRVYEKGFKEEAIKLSKEMGTKATAEQLGIPVTTLSTWRSQQKQHGEIAFVGSGNKRIDPQISELRKMEKKIKELEVANDILKKALGFFAESQKK